MARPSIPEQGYPATRLKAVDLLGEQEDREKLRATKKSKVELPDFEYGVYEDVTSKHAESFEQWSVNLNNPEYAELVNGAIETGDMGSVGRYHARAKRVAKNLEQAGIRAREGEELFESDEAYKIPYNQDILRRRSRLISAMDPNDAYRVVGGEEFLIISEPEKLAGTSLESMMVPLKDGRYALSMGDEDVKNLYFFDKSMLISPEDWVVAAKKHSADIVKWSRTEEEPNASGNIVTTKGGQRIDTDKLFYNSALRLFEDANQAYIDDPGEDVALPEFKGGYRLNAMSASMYAKMYPDQADGGDYRGLIGKKVSTEVANNLLANFVSVATEGEVTDNRFSRRVEAVKNSGGGGGVPREKFNITPKRLNTDQPIRVGTDYTVSYQKQPVIKWENVPEDKSSKGYISDSTVMMRPDGTAEVTVTYTTTPGSVDYYETDERKASREEADRAKAEADKKNGVDVGGETRDGSALRSAMNVEQDKEDKELKRQGKTAVTKYTKTLTLQEANELRSQLGYKSFKEWYDDQQSIGEEADKEWFASRGADNLLDELETEE